jgi:hypothetical protein
MSECIRCQLRRILSISPHQRFQSLLSKGAKRSPVLTNTLSSFLDLVLYRSLPDASVVRHQDTRATKAGTLTGNLTVAVPIFGGKRRILTGFLALPS